MKEHKMSRRNFLKVGAVASAAGLMTAAPCGCKRCRSGRFHRS